MPTRALVGVACAAAVFAISGIALGRQAGNQVELQLRLVPQAGVPSTPPGAGVIDIAAAADIDGSAQVRRFEVQYRIVRFTSNVYTPAGLSACNLRIVASGSAGNGSLRRALLSRFESTQAAGAPPATSDASGLATNAFATATGLHRPFRASIPPPIPNNDTVANGELAANGLAITRITPLTLSQSDQNAPGGGDGQGAWYGLYSIDFVSGTSLPAGNITITASVDADAMTGNRFGFYDDGNPVPITASSATNAAATFTVLPTGACCGVDGSCTIAGAGLCANSNGGFLGVNSVCTPAACPPGGACCRPSSGCAVLTSAACSSQAGLYSGNNTACGPTLCPPPYACCFPNFVCLLANTLQDCTGAGGQIRLSSTCSPQLCCPAVGFTIQPQSRVFTPPETVLFSATASSPAPITYQWRKGGFNLANNGRISGATTAVLTIAGTQSSDAGEYDVLATTSCGTSIVSTTATLTICSGPTIVTQPAAVAGVAGGNASFAVAASGAGELAHQWRKDGIPLAPSARVTGTASPTLAIVALVPSDDGLYDCIVSSPCGVVTSQLASLTVSCAGAGLLLDCNGNGVCDELELAGGRDLTAPAPGEDDKFGWAASIDATRVLIGARTADAPGVENAGAAYMFTGGSGGVWSLEATFTDPGGAPYDDFGNQVAVQGQWAVVAARFAAVGGVPGAGAVLIYRNTGGGGGGWTFFQKLTEPTPTPNSQFGHGVDLDGDKIVVGALHAFGAQSDSGAAFIYRFNGVNWSREITLLAPDGARGDGFGISVAIDDPYAIVGAPYDTDGGVSSGSAYVFFRSVTGWVLQSKVRARVPQTLSTFGELVAISGDIALVNCPRETVGGLPSAGAIYTYRRTDTRWTQQRRLTAPTPEADELFGYYIAIEDSTLVAGGFRRTVAGFADSGAVDVFERRGNFWTRADRIDSPRPETPGFFGYSLALSGGRLVAGAYRGTARLQPNAGWVRVFDLNALDCNDNDQIDVCEIAGGTATDSDGNGIPDDCQSTLCLADFNGNGVLSVQDVFDYLSDYFTANLTADFNDNGFLSVQDIFDFLTAYFAGCV